MSLDGLAALGDAAGERAVRRKISEIAQAVNLPSDVKLSATATGVEIFGKALRRRMIDDPRLRNFAR